MDSQDCWDVIVCPSPPYKIFTPPEWEKKAKKKTLKPMPLSPQALQTTEHQNSQAQLSSNAGYIKLER